MNESQIEIYQIENGSTEIQVKLENETVWLSLNHITELFDRDKSVISRHIKNIYKEGELIYEATVAKNATVQLENGREVECQIDYYNLDVIISVGYRIKSQRGIQFRIWANKILKDYLIKGYSINQQRLAQETKKLKELQQSVKILGNIISQQQLSNDESLGLLKIISDYAYALDILDRYDYQSLEITETSGKDKEAMRQVNWTKKMYGNSDLFGNPKDESFKSSIATIYQTYNGIDLYPSIEEKAANLLYFITKNHSFTDGNKRIAAFLFLYFMERNGILYDLQGNKRIADNTLVALTLMIAVSKRKKRILW
jgi:prophage maintenance system killer protein